MPAGQVSTAADTRRPGAMIVETRPAYPADDAPAPTNAPNLSAKADVAFSQPRIHSPVLRARAIAFGSDRHRT
jgi:hypothetical protein